MATHRESRAIALPAECLFDVVADVERYPEFVPLVCEARIVRREEAAYETEQSLALGLLLHRFRTRTELDRPHRISVRSSDRSFAHFDILWAFTPLADDRCHVDFALDCETRSLFLMPVIQLMVVPMAAGMVSAFEARAHALVAKSGGGAGPGG
ncbi:type II toxin-antitoxin system RatA family toxin [Accumulibacter sp.]|jgi:coenzyme Q-binding protein COQ10|uniref:type II toxin-antitoxin system RatA family toxin n=1 Tax=Accumulibacter sp. TaxID=2053492 RepID=UPI0012C935E9|nr:type II toxin-antitoxin system RatA family toxin [Accumulibacter sp.]MQM34971.1 ubiquinone-binding protein [Candidatus Accumulibacter phosphatis]